MAKKKQSKKPSKQQSRKQAEQAAAEKAKKAAKRARQRATELVDEAKTLRRSADKAVRKAEKAETKAADARAAAGFPAPEAAQPDETDLPRLALRTAEAKLVDTERRLEAAQQELAGQRRLEDDDAEEALEDAVVDAAVEITVADAVAEAVAEAQLEGDAVIEADLVEAVAVELDDTVTDVDAAGDDSESHEGDAEEAAEVFQDASAADEPALVPTEATPPLPAAAADDRPSESWTLVRLRQEAKNRGLTGTSNLSKSALVARLQQA